MRVTGERIYHGKRFEAGFVAAIARSEWPLVEAAFGPTLVLLAGWAGALSDRTALTAALSAAPP